MRTSLFFYFLLVYFVAPQVKGQVDIEKKAMSIIDFLNVPSVSDLKLSPDGKNVVYGLSESDWKANKQIKHIWKVGINGDNNRQITYGKEGEDDPLWSPDGQWISFVTKRGDDKENQIYIMHGDGGEGMRLTNHLTSISSPSWSADSKYLYYVAKDTLSKIEEKAKKIHDDVYKLDENFKQKHLWKVSLSTKETSRITSGNFSVMNYDVSKNGEQILTHRGINPLYDFYKESELYIMDSNGQNMRQLTTNGIGERYAQISPKGDKVLFIAGANEKFESYYNNKLFVMSLDKDSQPVILTKDWPYDISEATWSADGQSIFLRVNMGSEMQLWEYELSKKNLKQLTKGKHSITHWNYNAQSNQHITAVNTMQNPGDIYKLNKNTLEQLTHHFDYLEKEYHLPKQEVISWKGEDGTIVEGILYYPNNYKPGQSYPLVVQTHGGPASSDRYGFSRSFTRYNPVLTAQGYVVLQPNYRGSTGYGDIFLRDMVGGYFRHSHLDVMAGVDYLVEKGIADPNRMVKMGWSAGGHMTNKLITFTNRFKAASSGAGAVNWIGMYAQSDIRTYRTPWFGGSPWQKDAPIDVYWNNSPLKDISNVTTPTLVIVGENDVRVPLTQSIELYRALRSLDVPTHLYVAPREPHGWRELRHRLYKINTELEWFAKYALDQSYEWEVVEEEEGE